MADVSAGGVVYRCNKSGSLQLLAIEDRFGYYSLPKGMQEAGETLQQTALREILEETGVKGEIEAELPSTAYPYTYENEKREKRVYYYLVKATSGEINPQLEEINGAKWLEAEEFWQVMSQSGYENNLSVVREALGQLGLRLES